MERRIGEQFKYNGKTFETKESVTKDCKGCYFEKLEWCPEQTLYSCFDNDEDGPDCEFCDRNGCSRMDELYTFGLCCSTDRKDKNAVIFIEVI